METHSKNTGFGGLSRRRCLAIWNSAAWRASKGGKSENSIAWEAVTAGKSENSLAWEAPTGGESENSLAWGAPTGGKSENSLAWGAPTGGKSENSLAWGAPTGGESENSLAWGAPTGGKSENSLAWGATGGKVKILSLGSPHGGKPPLAPLTDRNKPAVWAATPREAGWIPQGKYCLTIEHCASQYGTKSSRPMMTVSDIVNKFRCFTKMFASDTKIQIWMHHFQRKWLQQSNCLNSADSECRNEYISQQDFSQLSTSA